MKNEKGNWGMEMRMRTGNEEAELAIEMGNGTEQ